MTDSGNVYNTELSWLFGGFATIILACLLVVPLYWGWWKLERRYTMNPLETAKAFDAPLLRNANPFTRPIAWSQSMKEMQVRYGRGPLKDEGINLSYNHFENQSKFGRNLYVGSQEIGYMGANVDSEGQSLYSSHDVDLASARVPKFRKID